VLFNALVTLRKDLPVSDNGIDSTAMRAIWLWL
jgi:hypothetical protein